MFSPPSFDWPTSLWKGEGHGINGCAWFGGSSVRMRVAVS